MDGELTPEQLAEKEAAEKAAADDKDKKIAELSTRLEEVGKTLLSPEYAEFLASKAKAGEKPPATDEERKAFIAKLDEMPRAQLVAFIRDAVIQEVRQTMFDPLVKATISREAQSQVAKCAADHPDFEEVKPEMIKVAQQYPGISAEDAYQLAKTRKGGTSEPDRRTHTPPRPAETTSGRPASPKPKQNVTFTEAFDQAFVKAGFTE